MSQSASYGTTNSAISRGVKQQQQQQHITQSQQPRVQNIDMLSYNNGNNNNGNSNITVVAETGGNTFAIANSTTMDQTTSITSQNTNTGAIPKEKPGKNAKQQQPRKPPPTIDTFWPTVLQEVQSAVVDSKHQSLPLARIKKIMKLDENAKMIAAEAPTLFAKACEFFIQELTMRAWIHTDESKRRTLQRSDIAQAIANYDQFDFLIDIVPREDIKPPNHRRHHNESTSSANNTASTTNSPAPSNSSMSTTVSNMVTGEILNVSGLPVENISGGAVSTALPTTATITGNLNQTQPQMLTTASTTTNHSTPQLQIIQQTAHPQQHLQYFITLPGQQTGQAQLVHQLQLQQQQQQHINNGLAAGTPLTAASLNLVAQQPQQLILTAANPNAAQAANVVQHQQQTALLQNIAQHQQQQQQAQQQQQHPQQQVQLLQQVMLTPNGELTNMPIAINANQLNLLRLQMQHQQQQQQQQQQQHHQQQVIIPTHLLTAQQILQLQAQAQNQAQANNAATTTHIVHHQPHITQQQQHHHQQQQQTQHHPQTTTSTNNIYINSNTVAANQATSAAASMVSTDRNMGSTFRNNC